MKGSSIMQKLDSKVTDSIDFFQGINPYELVEKIEENLHANFKNSEYDVYDYYYMRIEKNGIVNNKIVSTVEIMTIKNTMNIIDLKPSDKEKHRRLLTPISPIKLTMQD